PDRDIDCVADAEDICPDEPGRVDLFGCPDTDQDGLADHLDPCPEEAGLLQYSGCPLPDTDCDGVLDTFDLCPTVTDTTNFSGCPDTDQDGLIDLVDRCPEQSGPLENKGCPQLAETEQKVLVDAQRDVRFKTGRADLLASSKDILNKIVEILEKYPAYHLRLDGYTDSVGREVTNQKLSENRAKSCFMYLIGQGIEEDRLSFSGYGEENPIGDNKTKAGRQLNRRVEFELFLPTIKSETDLDAKKDK
ncbi:MAG: OmpA family protein, partial [Saprospiraceae bacterium]|nr:OmpA family protein [Saprospiraceae bacterium]